VLAAVRFIVAVTASLQVVGLASRVGLSAEVGSGGAALGEVAGEDGLEERSEDNLGTSSLGKSHPENQNKLEGVVEWEPIDGVDGTLKDSQKRICNPVCQPLSIIDLAGAEQGVQRVVAGDEESSDVNEESTGNVEEDQEEVESTEAQDDVDLGHRRLLLEVVEGGVLGQLFVELRQVCLSFILNRHDVWSCGSWA